MASTASRARSAAEDSGARDRRRQMSSPSRGTRISAGSLVTAGLIETESSRRARRTAASAGTATANVTEHTVGRTHCLRAGWCFFEAKEQLTTEATWCLLRLPVDASQQTVANGRAIYRGERSQWVRPNALAGAPAQKEACGHGRLTRRIRPRAFRRARGERRPSAERNQPITGTPDRVARSQMERALPARYGPRRLAPASARSPRPARHSAAPRVMLPTNA